VNPYVLAAWNEEELTTVPFHSYLRWCGKEIEIIDSDGNSYSATSKGISGVNFKYMRCFGLGASLVAAVFSGFNVFLKFKLAIDKVQNGTPVFDDVKRVVKNCVDNNPNYYTRMASKRAVVGRITRASSYRELIMAISNVDSVADEK